MKPEAGWFRGVILSPFTAEQQVSFIAQLAFGQKKLANFQIQAVGSGGGPFSPSAIGHGARCRALLFKEAARRVFCTACFMAGRNATCFWSTLFMPQAGGSSSIYLLVYGSKAQVGCQQGQGPLESSVLTGCFAWSGGAASKRLVLAGLACLVGLGWLLVAIFVNWDRPFGVVFFNSDFPVNSPPKKTGPNHTICAVRSVQGSRPRLWHVGEGARTGYEPWTWPCAQEIPASVPGAPGAPGAPAFLDAVPIQNALRFFPLFCKN